MPLPETYPFAAPVEPRLAGVMLLTHDLRILYADPQICALLGMPEESAGGALQGALAPETLAAVRVAIATGGGPLPLGSGEAAAVAVERLPAADGREAGLLVRVLQEAPAARAAAAATRDALVNRVERALARARRRSDYTFGLLWIDFRLEDPSGDELRVVELLQDAVRPMDMAAHLGPGRYGVLLHGLNDEVDAFHVARRLHRALRTQAGGDPATGAVLSADATTADVMLRQAEAAAALGRWERVRVAAFEPRRHLRASQQLRVEEELPPAIADGQMRLYYQPIMSVVERRPVGFEALVRWEHPQDGLLLPDRFVPAAERADLVAQLDHWALAAAARRAQGWLEAGVLGSDGFVSVNFSGRTLDREDSAERALGALAAAGLPPERLQLEITETALVERTGVANANLLRLRAQGVRVAIDDFGSGYCSLAYLQRLPVDALKLDRSLLRGRTDGVAASRLLQGVLALARCMELPVTIEGVETAGDVDFLEEVGAGHAQGFAFSPPLDEREAEHYAAPAGV